MHFSLDKAKRLAYIVGMRRKKMDKAARKQKCKHPPNRLYAWRAYDGTLCIACCDCGIALKGAISADEIEKLGR
jgi:hypothetical protein